VELSPAQINAPDADNWTPLHHAAQIGNAYVASALIKAGADVNAGGDGCSSALMIASKNGNLAIVKVLLDVGLSLQVNAKDIRGYTALHLSVQASCLPVVEALLEARADVNAVNADGMTPLFYASSAATARALLDAGANADHRGKLGYLRKISKTSSKEINVLDTNMLRLLPAIPVAAPLLSDRGPALSVAVQEGNSLLVEKMLTSGHDPNIADNNGATPLMVAHDVEMARRLLDARADVNARLQDGTTALMFAVSDDNKDAALVTLLLKCGADVSASRKDGGNSIMLAALKDRVDKLTLLLHAPHAAAACVNEQTQTGATALIVASAYGATAAVEALIAAGADVHLTTTTRYTVSHTALHYSGNADIARLLWNAGAKFEFSMDGDDALTYACVTNT
jgi:ankyrin repeat protein